MRRPAVADVTLAKAILVAKYAPAKIRIDSPALGGLSTVMNIWNTFKSTPKSKPKPAYVLETLRTGTQQAFLSTTWNCASSPIEKEPVICNAGEYQVLFVEQHIAMALEVADRAYVLNRGDLVLSGSAAELRGRRDLVEASYLGEATIDEAAESAAAR